MYYIIEHSNTGKGESLNGKPGKQVHTYLIRGLQGEALAEYLRDNPACNRPDVKTGLPMIRSFDKRHRGEMYCYRSNRINEKTQRPYWSIISFSEIEKRYMAEYPMLLESDAGMRQIAKYATQELREIVAGKVAPVDAPAVAPDVAPDQVTPTVAPDATADPVDEQQSDAGSAPF